MRRTILVIASSLALVASLPATALARHHHRSRAHAAHRHHARRAHARHATLRRFGTFSNRPSITSGQSGSSSNGAGKVTSFDGTKLVITLNDGTVVSGNVTSESDITCQAAGSQGSSSGDGSSGSGDGSSSSGDGSSSSGDGSSSGDNSSSSGDQGSSSSMQSDESSSQSGSQDSSSGDDQSDGGDQSGSQQCTPTPGMTVDAAELSVSSAGAVWKEVELTS